MSTKTIRASYIFEKGQHLTLQKARDLKGEKISCTSPEYSANKLEVKTFIVGEIKPIDENTIGLYNNEGKWQYNCYLNGYSDVTFAGSDSDRFVSFITL